MRGRFLTKQSGRHNGRRGRWAAFGLIGVALLAGGCGQADGKESASARPAAAPEAKGGEADPVAALHEQLHGGKYQADGALENLHDAVTALEPLVKQTTGETSAAIQGVLDTFNETARTLADHVEAPALDEIRRDTATYEKRRQTYITETNDAITDLREASATLDDMLDSGPPPAEKAAIQKASEATDTALDALTDSVQLLGGKPPAEDEKTSP